MASFTLYHSFATRYSNESTDERASARNFKQQQKRILMSRFVPLRMQKKETPTKSLEADLKKHAPAKGHVVASDKQKSAQGERELNQTSNACRE
jgi:hypothetical protein